MTSELPTKQSKRPIPRKLNQGMIDALSLAISKGNYAVTACQLAGIAEPSLYDWINLAKEDQEAGRESIYTSLVKSLKKAEAQAEAALVEVVREAGTVKREWLPAMTFLERRHPDRWGRKDRTRVDINETKTIKITRVEVLLNPGQEQPAIIEGEVVNATEEEEG